MLPYDLNSNYTFKIAETKEELEEAFKILHDAYVDIGFMSPHDSGMRVTVYHAIPQTTTVIAKYKEDVIGTVSIIRESPLGLPLDEDFDVSKVIKNSKNRAEISALAIHKKFRGNSGAVLLGLVKYICNYCTRYLEVDAVQIATSPARRDFYEALLSFEIVEDKIIKDNLVNGQEMMSLYLSKKHYLKSYQKNYDHKVKEKNLLHYIEEYEMPNLIFPEREYHFVNDPVMTPELMKYFFCEKTDKFNHLKSREKIALRNIYEDDLFLSVIPETPKNIVSFSKRSSARYAVNIPAQIQKKPGLKLVKNQHHIDDCKKHQFEVAEVSLNGFSTKNLKKKFNPDDTYCVQLIIGPFKITSVEAKLAWSKGNSHAFKIIEHNNEWYDFINHLYMAINKKHKDHRSKSSSKKAI